MEPAKRRRILKWALVSVIVSMMVATAGWYWFSSRHFEPWQFLAHVVQLEQSGVDPMALQNLGSTLAILGRDDEVRRLDFHPQFPHPPSRVKVAQLELNAIPWKDAIETIAGQHRIVMVMEDHFSSKHREFIGATLPLFHAAGFTHYAAEAIGPVDQSLMRRGYPSSMTGLYTSDPRFGNAIRQALQLNLHVLGYDFRPFTHDGREEFAATELAKCFRDAPDVRMVVHAGYSHVLKFKTDNGERWLAARLWEQTGIEPFTIWQWSAMHDAADYDRLVHIVKEKGVSMKEPLLLMPPPGGDCGLQDSPYGLAKVDAIVLHPPDRSVAPSDRTVLFPDRMQQIDGHWTGEDWPVVISAYKKGEPASAIPLDQVMLRENESRFRLWIPTGTDPEIRVFNRHGLLKSLVTSSPDSLEVGLP